jgi:hypothetical protein
VKKRILKADRKNTYKKQVQMSEYFSSESIKARKQWNNVFKMPENCHPRIVHLAKLSLQHDIKIRHSQIKGN